MRYRPDVTATDVLLISLLAWWGFWLIVPFSQVEGVQAYRPLFDLAPQQVWAGLMVLVSVAKVYSILRCRWWLRMSTLFLMNAWWVFVSASVFVANPASPGWGMIGILALVSIYRNMQVAAMRNLVEESCDYRIRR